MTEHRHLVDGQPSAALQIAWCRCGATLDLRTQKWGPPRYLTGRVRSATWKGDE